MRPWRFYDSSRPSYHGQMLLVDLAFVAAYAGAAIYSDAAILWILLGMMLMRLATSVGRWQRARRGSEVPE